MPEWTPSSSTDGAVADTSAACQAHTQYCKDQLMSATQHESFMLSNNTECHTIQLLNHNKVQGVPEKIAQSLCTTILQPYVTVSCGFRQNVQKDTVYTIKAIKYSLFCSWQVKYLKTKLTAKSLKQIRRINKVRVKPTFQN